jgi:hypothetical protein
MATTKIQGNLVNFNPGDPDYVWNTTTAVTVINPGSGNQYNFDGKYGKFGARIGTIQLTGVPSGHPFALINNGKTSEISYTGTVNEGTGTGPDGNTYTFYSGTITITVSSDFDTISYYCLNHGYMGGQNNLVYTYSENGLKLPSGTELNRPTAVSGALRNNTNESSAGSASTIEVYDGSSWQAMGLYGTAAVTTDAATSVADLSMTLNGTVTNLGAVASVTAGFYLGTSATYTANTKYTVSTSQALGSYTYAATGLTAATQYYITAFVNNGAGEVVGSTVAQATTFNPTLVSSGGSFFEVRSGSYTNPRLETNFIHPTTSVLTRIDFFEQGQGGVGQNPMNYNDVSVYVGINGCRGTYYGGFPAGKNFYNMWDNPGGTCYPQLRQASGVVNVTRAGFFYPGNMNSDNRMDLRNIPGGFNGNVVIDAAYDQNVTGGTKTQFGANQCLRDNTSYTSGNGCWISLKYTLN